MSGFELIEHTADVGLRAWGDTIEEAFEDAALGMFSIMGDISKADEVGEVEVVVENEELEGLLVDWLSELLYLFDAERAFLCRFHVKMEENGKIKLSGRAYGEEYNAEKHGMGTEIKAVTYHMLEADREKKEIRVLFDI